MCLYERTGDSPQFSPVFPDLFRDVILCPPTNIDATPVTTSGKIFSRSKLSRRRNALSAKKQRPNGSSALAAESSSRAPDFIRRITAANLTRRALKQLRRPANHRLRHRPMQESRTQERLRQKSRQHQRKNRAIDCDSSSLDIHVRESTRRHSPEERQSRNNRLRLRRCVLAMRRT